ncbi:hypothetical protein TrispH2_001769 [Trichoplax sp. H2]|nr:hypothetical protein TrispH2_001769 [Trichoplax sp. H2]|eukprot:RDD46111.1 hypothetical protein TrispH2_001769 [Trichoplax sp. H2]
MIWIENPFSSYSDFESEPPFVWTLIESLSFKNYKDVTYHRGFPVDAPFSECNSSWALFRLSAAKMSSIIAAYGSVHFPAICNFNPNIGTRLKNRRDYSR